jgi:signal transduction histidine kinase
MFVLFEGQASNKKISLRSGVPEGFVVKADRNMLKTVLHNLISNAVKFTGYEGTVTLSASEISGFINISVTDTGIGLSTEDIGKLFRIDVNNKEIGNSKEKGTGLGLILCREFVERHNGTIRAESKPGEGSRFVFTLPA